MFAGLFVGIVYYMTLILTVDNSMLSSSPPQWPILLIATLAGFIGSSLDSLLAAFLQYSGL